jgi:pyridoxamine 5'-phosphate oxidase
MEAARLADMRRDYKMEVLDEETCGDEPFTFFRYWFDEAARANVDDVNAMTLATSDSEGRPHARIVLLKGIEGPGFTFFTNYESEKGRQLDQQPYAALCFFWKELERQVRIEGLVEKVNAAESDAYFHSRPVGSRIGAWASPQSAVIADRSILEERAAQFEAQYPDGNVPRPSYWGGYRLVPTFVEFWQGRSNRLHDRIVFRRNSPAEPWERSRLAP